MPPTPSGFWRSWFGPAPKPSMETLKQRTSSFLITRSSRCLTSTAIRRSQRGCAPSHRHPSELDGLLGARLDALAARLAGRRLRRVGRLAAVRDALELREHAELGEVGLVDAAHLEHVDRADLHALRLALALRSIDDRCERTRLGLAGSGR